MDRRDVASVALLATAAFALSALSISTQHVANRGFLFGDDGHNLLLVDTLLKGGSLYRDVFSQYGPIPAYAHALTASLFGNTPLVYLLFLAVVSSAGIGVAYVLVRRAASVPVATCVCAFGILPVLINPGSLIGGYTDAAYIPFERLMVLLVAVAWTRPDERTAFRSVMIGTLLGLMQGVRFGGAAVAGASILVLDGASITAVGVGATGLRRWTASLALIAAAFAGVELLWAAWAFLSLPSPLAIDVLWPSYMLQNYPAYVTPDLRWPSWGGWRLFVGQYLLPASAGALGLAGLVSWIRDPDRDRAAVDGAAVFFPLILYAIGSFTLFRMVHHFRQFMWALVPASVWMLERRGAGLRAVAGALWLPPFATCLRAVLIPAMTAVPFVTVSLPSGGAIQVSPAVEAQLRFLQRLTSAEIAQAPVLFMPIGSGWHVAYHVPRATRHTYFSPALLRPYEEDAFIASLDRTPALITCNDRQRFDRPEDLPLDRRVAAVLISRLEPWMSEAGCRVFRIRHSP